jgi:uncharacterized protein
VIKIRVALLWVLLGLWAVGSRAEVVADLYSASVPVANQSSEALAPAAREALSEVLVKVSGSRELLQKPAIAAALDDARSQVQQYGYERGEPPAGGLFLRFTFDGPYITNLVKRAGAPLWTANRPTVLAWVVVEDAQGRHFINRDTSPQEAQLLVEEFSRRGVPVQLPVFDLADTTAASLDDAWRLDAKVLQAASIRYNVGNVIAGRLAAKSDGKFLGDWSYFQLDEPTNLSIEVPDLKTFLREGAHVVATEMSGRYAVAASGGSAAGVHMSVSGVSSYADYAAIVKWLEGLELVDHANLEQVQGDRIELRLQAQANAQQLAATIELNDRFVRIPTPAPAPGVVPEAGSEAAPETQLNYQWRK